MLLADEADEEAEAKFVFISVSGVNTLEAISVDDDGGGGEGDKFNWAFITEARSLPELLASALLLVLEA